MKIFPAPRNLLNDMTRRQRAKEDKQKVIETYWDLLDDTARRQRAKGDNKKLVRWGETKNIPNTPQPIEWHGQEAKSQGGQQEAGQMGGN